MSNDYSFILNKKFVGCFVDKETADIVIAEGGRSFAFGHDCIAYSKSYYNYWMQQIERDFTQGLRLR